MFQKSQRNLGSAWQKCSLRLSVIITAGVNQVRSSTMDVITRNTFGSGIQNHNEYIQKQPSKLLLSLLRLKSAHTSTSCAAAGFERRPTTPYVIRSYRLNDTGEFEDFTVYSYRGIVTDLPHREHSLPKDVSRIRVSVPGHHPCLRRPQSSVRLKLLLQFTHMYSPLCCSGPNILFS